MSFDHILRPTKLDGHVASPGFLRTGSTGKTERCTVLVNGKPCRRWLRASKTSPTGWRHSGLHA